ncbi:MAG TPA: hypothetical protein VNR68_01675 [Sphingomicrobium sp.]|nr:hypothetical protein [Sphingomicrobium sp.]
MRSNSGKDESRNNLRDPTIRDREKERTEVMKHPEKPDVHAPSDQRDSRKD